MAVQTIEDLKKSFSAGKIPTQQDFENLIDTLATMGGDSGSETVDYRGKNVILPVNYHDYGFGNEQANAYSAVSIDNIFTYFTTGEYPIISIEEPAEVDTITIINEGYYPYHQEENPVPLYVKTNQIVAFDENNILQDVRGSIVTIPLGYAVTFVRNKTEHTSVNIEGHNPNGEWYPVSQSITISEEELEALRNGSGTSGS